MSLPLASCLIYAWALLEYVFLYFLGAFC